MTKRKKLSRIKHAAEAVESGIFAYACNAIEDIGGRELKDQFDWLFRPPWCEEGFAVWTFGSGSPHVDDDIDDSLEEVVNARLLAMCLFHEIVKDEPESRR